MERERHSIPAPAHTVVLVDDDAATVRTMCRVLQRMDIRCECTSSAIQAVELVRTLQPAVLLADFEMPELDGLTLLKRAGLDSPSTVRVLMSAHTDVGVLERALNEAHAEYYLAKPFEAADIRRVITRALERSDRTRRGEALLASTSAERLQLDVIARAQRQVLESKDIHLVFESLLDGALEVTGSSYGFIGEVGQAVGGAPYLKTLAVSNLAWNDATRRSYDEHAREGLEFHNLDTLFGAVLSTKQVVLNNDPSADPRGLGVTGGHPELDSFLGIPFLERGELVGMVFVANRPGGYSPELVASLSPFIQTCTTLVRRDASERKRAEAEEQLAHERLRFEATFAASLDGLVIADKDGRILRANPALCEMFGFTRSELEGALLEVLIPVNQRALHRERIGMYRPGTASSVVNKKRRLEGQRRDGNLFPIELSVVLIDDPVLGHSFAGTIRDLTEQLRQEQAILLTARELERTNAELQRLASTDRLTGLENRGAFDEALAAELNRSARTGARFALALCDIDHFKDINDQLGHQVGDEFLVRTANALKEHFRRSGERVARWGGEEFAILVPHAPTLADAEQVGQRALEAVRSALMPRPRCSTGELLTVSVGVASSQGDQTDSVHALLRAADNALYEAKRSGRNRACVAGLHGRK